jgi:flavorubredoxin
MRLLYEDGKHRCVVFRHILPELTLGSSQYLIMDGEHGALLDPGGALGVRTLFQEVAGFLAPDQLAYLLLSHQDPDVCGSVGSWLESTECRICMPQPWVRFVPHLLVREHHDAFARRVVGIPDDGAVIELGDAELLALPQHFLHSDAALSFYDPVSKILFCGDIGASESDGDQTTPEQVDALIEQIEPWHRRHMGSRAACAAWTARVRSLDLNLLAPQHGGLIQGAAAIGRFLDWFEHLECGQDLLLDRGAETGITTRVPREPVEHPGKALGSVRR